MLAWFKKEMDKMIEIEIDKERNLKNLKQIGTPKEENKIYVEHMVYAKLKENSYREKRVFVLMGHTERMSGKYVTFIEGVIPVREIEFQGNTPRWNNSTWSEIFREIRRLYEDKIIVGWAIDIKGMTPRVTHELERVHREHFGGVHQLLFLLNTLEQEEVFYIYKENRIVPKDGFYIYHRARTKENIEGKHTTRELIPIKIRETTQREETNLEHQVGVEVDILPKEEAGERKRGGSYRQLINEKKQKVPTDEGNIGVAIAVAMLVFVIGVGLYEDRDKILGTNKSLPANVVQEENTEEIETEAAVDIIPVDVISGTEDSEK